jgi:hypothetical protein
LLANTGILGSNVPDTGRMLILFSYLQEDVLVIIVGHETSSRENTSNALIHQAYTTKLSNLSNNNFYLYK